MANPGDIGVAVQIIRSLVRVCEAMNIDMNGLLRKADISRAELNDVDARIPIIKEHKLWSAAAEAAGDPLIGLHAAQHLTAGDLDVLDYAVRTSNTLGDSLANLCRYNRLLHDVAQLALEANNGLAILSHELHNIPRANSCRHAVEFTFASIVTIGTQLCGKDFTPRVVNFCHPSAGDSAHYTDIFSCPVHFDCSQDLIVFDEEVLTWPVLNSDARLNSVLTRHAEQLLSRLPTNKRLADKVRQLVLESLQSGYKGIEQISSLLHMTPRTLQRKLRAEGTNYSEIVNDSKMKLARSYLLEKSLSISETAYLLGYSEVSAFRRAFKRWSGVSPDNYRKSKPAGLLHNS